MNIFKKNSDLRKQKFTFENIRLNMKKLKNERIECEYEERKNGDFWYSKIYFDNVEVSMTNMGEEYRIEVYHTEKSGERIKLALEYEGEKDEEIIWLYETKEIKEKVMHFFDNIEDVIAGYAKQGINSKLVWGEKRMLKLERAKT